MTARHGFVHYEVFRSLLTMLKIETFAKIPEFYMITFNVFKNVSKTNTAFFLKDTPNLAIEISL